MRILQSSSLNKPGAEYMVTGLSPIIRFFMKSKKAKYDVMSLNTHSTDDLTLLMDELNASPSAVRWPALKGTCRYTLKG